VSLLPPPRDGSWPGPAPDADAAEASQIEQWWKGLSPDARSAFSACLDGPIPAEYLDEVLAAGIRVVGAQNGDTSMVWRFSPRVRRFIAHAAGMPDRDTVPSLGTS
jgi:hypothetical protein